MSYTNGICLRNCKINGFPDFDSIKDLPEGTLVEFIISQDSKQVIRVFTYDNRTIKREKPLYITSGDNLQLIDKNLWTFLVAINNAEDRLKFVKNHQLVDFVTKNLTVNDEVLVKTETTGDDYVRGIVKYIALVPELGSGNYFGVEIPELVNVLPNKSITGESIRLTYVVSVQMIKPAESYSSNNSSAKEIEEVHKPILIKSDQTDLNGREHITMDEEMAQLIKKLLEVHNPIIIKSDQTDLNGREHNHVDEQDEAEDKETAQLIKNLLEEGVAMKCPKCGIIIEKDDGCDMVTCTVCETEICWATKGPRWGPAGRGDTSGGCKCTPEKRCAPSCENCH